MNKEIVEEYSNLIIGWLDTHPEFKINGMCEKLGINSGNFYKALKMRSIPAKFIPAIIEFLSHYGFVTEIAVKEPEPPQISPEQVPDREKVFPKSDADIKTESVKPEVKVQTLTNNKNTNISINTRSKIEDELDPEILKEITRLEGEIKNPPKFNTSYGLKNYIYERKKLIAVLKKD